MAASDEKKMIVGSTLKANGWSRNRSPNTKMLPLSVRSEIQRKASPIAVKTTLPGVVLRMMTARTNWSRVPTMTTRAGNRRLFSLKSHARPIIAK
jgi:hypothetical protein